MGLEIIVQQSDEDASYNLCREFDFESISLRSIWESEDFKENYEFIINNKEVDIISGFLMKEFKEKVIETIINSFEYENDNSTKTLLFTKWINSMYLDDYNWGMLGSIEKDVCEDEWKKICNSCEK